jgi:hypothetical protein
VESLEEKKNGKKADEEMIDTSKKPVTTPGTTAKAPMTDEEY